MSGPTKVQAVVQANSGGGASNTQVTLAATGAGNLLVAFGSSRVPFAGGSYTGCSDSSSRVWTPYANITNFDSTAGGGNLYLSIWTAPVGAGGDTPTITMGFSGSDWVQGGVIEVTGADTSTTPISTFATASSHNSTSFSIGPTGTSGAAELAISFFGEDGNGTAWTAPAGWATAIQTTNALNVGLSWLAVASQTATAAWTCPNDAVGGVIVVIKAAGGAVISDGTDDTLPHAPGLKLGTPVSRLRSAFSSSTAPPVTIISDGTDDTAPRAPGLRRGTPFSRLRASVIDSTDRNVTAILTGNAAAFTAGTLLDSHSNALTGQSALFTAGSFSHADSEPLTGQKATFSAGSVSPSISKALTGASASFSAGTVTAVLPLVAAQDGRVTMPRAGLRVGTPRSRLRASVFDSTDSNISAALSGVVLVSTGGSLKAAATKALSGQSAAFAAGTIKPSLAVAPSGQLASFTPGTLVVPGNVTAALTGVVAVFAAGTILVPSAASQDAGRKTRRRRQYIVRIDSQEFVCQTAAEAIELLRRAKEAAQLFALKQVEQAKIEGGRVKLPTIAAPSIHARSAELREIVTQTRQEIAKVYRDTLINTEIMMLFELERRNIEDDNDSIALLL